MIKAANLCTAFLPRELAARTCTAIGHRAPLPPAGGEPAHAPFHTTRTSLYETVPVGTLLEKYARFPGEPDHIPVLGGNRRTLGEPDIRNSSKTHSRTSQILSFRSSSPAAIKSASRAISCTVSLGRGNLQNGEWTIFFQRKPSIRCLAQPENFRSHKNDWPLTVRNCAERKYRYGWPPAAIRDVPQT